MLKSVQSSLLAQAFVFALVFTGFFVVESRPYSESFFDSLLAYVTWVPAMWGGVLGGFLSYILLILVAIVSLALSARDALRRWALPLFNISAFLWTLFPWISYQFGDYRGP